MKEEENEAKTLIGKEVAVTQPGKGCVQSFGNLDSVHVLYMCVFKSGPLVVWFWLDPSESQSSLA